MHAVSGVAYTTPDGVERTLRSTRGAKRLMSDKFGREKSLMDILNEHGDDSLFEIAHFMMHDENGDPPDITLKQFVFRTPQTTEATAELMAAVMSALTQGKTPKNELEVMVREFLEAQNKLALQQLTLKNSDSGVSAAITSDSPDASTSGSTAKRSSKRSSSVTPITSAPATTAQA
jgi:hypothetical protein